MDRLVFPRSGEEVEIGAQVGLEHVFGVEAIPAAARKGEWGGFGAAAGELPVFHQQVETSGGRVQVYKVVVSDEADARKARLMYLLNSGSP